MWDITHALQPKDKVYQWGFRLAHRAESCSLTITSVLKDCSLTTWPIWESLSFVLNWALQHYYALPLTNLESSNFSKQLLNSNVSELKWFASCKKKQHILDRNKMSRAQWALIIVCPLLVTFKSGKLVKGWQVTKKRKALFILSSTLFLHVHVSVPTSN